MNSTIALLTDFGTTDSYVGVMKGVMRGICPDAALIDISHAVPAHNVRAGAFMLRNAYAYFPPGTVFLVVIDPGVGSTRRPIAARAGGYTFIAPDNGVLSPVLAELGEAEVVELANPHYRLTTVSHTFHGRDLFAPAAAYLARGDVALSQLGSPVDKPFTLPSPRLQLAADHISGEVMHIDHFGNIVTSIGPCRWLDDARLLLGAEADGVRITAAAAAMTLPGHALRVIRHAYHEVPRGELLLLIGSDGYLEIASNQGSANGQLAMQPGDPVTLRLS